MIWNLSVWLVGQDGVYQCCFAWAIGAHIESENAVNIPPITTIIRSENPTKQAMVEPLERALFFLES